MKIKEGPWGLVLRRLPNGCKYCITGMKMVIFITGLCNWPKSCNWYCPVSSDRKGRDITFANERRIRRDKEDKELMEEAVISGSKGASITGGEPLLVFPRVIKYIKLLKDHFGDDYHIHLYTNGTLIDKDKLIELKNAKLDEIRFHSFDENIIKKVKMASELGLSAGLEIPAIPGLEKIIKELIKKADNENVEFINLNEFEGTFETYNRLQDKGFKINRKNIGSVIKSEKTAIEILGWSKRNTRNISVHYCPIWVKDKIQLKNRFLRRAEMVKKPHEEITNEGLILKGVIIPPQNGSKTIARIIETLVNYGVDKQLITWNNGKKWIEIPHKKLTEKVLEILRKKLGHNIQFAIVEEFPTVERETINITYL